MESINPTNPAAAVSLAPLPVTTERFERLALGRIVESTTNPRKHFDEKKLAELAESITTSGVAIPILVRPSSEHWTIYELIDGARRLRASHLAGVADIPARIIECDDRTALELQTIANLQREDIHPLDEALGYRQLIERNNYDVPAIAARIGKSESYVYQRLKLTDLCELGRQMFWEEKITTTMAIMLARLQPEDQAEALRDRWAIANAKSLEDWIQREVMLDLHSAPWKKDDAQLLPSAGSCDACPKRTGASPALFPEVKKSDTCTDPKCFEAKKAAFVEVKRAEVKAKDPDAIEVSSGYRTDNKSLLTCTQYRELTAKEAKESTTAKRAVVVEGHKAGKTIWIEPSNNRGGYQKSDAEKEAERKRKHEEQIRAEVADRCLDEMLSQVNAPIHDNALRLLTVKMLDRLTKDGQKRLAKSWEVEPIKTTSQYSGSYIDVETPLQDRIKEMSRGSLFAAMVDIACRSTYQGDPDHTVFADFYPVDADKIEATVREEFAVMAAAKKKPAAKKPAPVKNTAKKKPGAKKRSKKSTGGK